MTTAVFAFRVDVNRYCDLQIIGDRLGLLDALKAGRPLPDTIHVRREEELPLGDAAFVTPGLPALSEHAVRALEDMLLPNGELLPLHCSAGKFLLYRCRTSLDALDPARSVVKRFRDGRILDIERFVFVPERLVGATVFAIRDNLLGIFVTDAFVARVAEAGLTGFDFRKVWEVRTTESRRRQ